MRFAIKIDWWWRPFMLFIAATAANSYVEVRGEEVRLRFGAGFDHTIARSNVVSARHGSWSLINGLGVRAGGTIVGLIGSTAGVVELELRGSVAMRFVGWPWVVRRVAVSVEDADGLIAALAAGAQDGDVAYTQA